MPRSYSGCPSKGAEASSAISESGVRPCSLDNQKNGLIAAPELREDETNGAHDRCSKQGYAEQFFDDRPFLTDNAGSRGSE